jgi:hypothetical protein
VKRFLIALTLFFTLISCAPAARGPVAMPIKTGEVWTMTATKPKNTPQVFELELYSEFEEDEDDLWIADAEAGRFDASILYSSSNNFMIVIVELTRGNDPEIAFCSFPNSKPGRTRVVGFSFFGKTSELKAYFDDKLPDREGACNIELTQAKP